MLQISITITGDKQVINRLSRLDSSLYNFRDALTKVGREGAKYYSTVGFLSQGGVFGATWRPLSPAYAAYKARHYPGRPPLVRTGKMKDSFDYSAGNNQVVIGNRAPYFVYHQSSAPRRRLPRRPTLGINDPIQRIVRDIIDEDVRRKIKAVS